MTASLIAKGIVKRFDGNPVLRSVDFELKHGSITALLGRSGSGKTTLLRALSLVEPPDEGELHLFGERIEYPQGVSKTGLSPWPRLTVVFQDLFLWPHLTCGENVEIAARARCRLNGKRRANEVMDSLGVGFLSHRYPVEVSRGQRQMIAFARAAALDPEILLCDEITASLDVEAAARVGDAIDNLRENGCAVLLITHQISFARQKADFIYYLENGRIVESGDSTMIDMPRSDEFRRFINRANVAP